MLPSSVPNASRRLRGSILPLVCIWLPAGLAALASGCVEIIPPLHDSGAPVEMPGMDGASGPGASGDAACEIEHDAAVQGPDGGQIDASTPWHEAGADATIVGPEAGADATIVGPEAGADATITGPEAGPDATVTGPEAGVDAASCAEDASTHDDAGDTDAGASDELECYTLRAHAQGDLNAKFPVGAAVDRYMNFGFQAPWTGTVYGLVFRPVVDDARSVREVWLYREPAEPGIVVETIGQHASADLIYGWGPGGTVIDFRDHSDDVGVELPPTTYSLEIHYNSSDPSARDNSGLEVCVARRRPTNLASLSWLGYEQGGVLSFATGICLEPETQWTGTCRPATSEPIHLLAVTPRMRGTGRHMTATITGPNGSRVLHDRPFDIIDQRTYETHEVLMPGESIVTRCTFSAPNCAGQATSQERCHLLTYAWPAGALTDNGVEATFVHGAGACMGQ